MLARGAEDEQLVGQKEVQRIPAMLRIAVFPYDYSEMWARIVECRVVSVTIQK
jgi:hypothetical protein